jgi:hypothetical protein
VIRGFVLLALLGAGDAARATLPIAPGEHDAIASRLIGQRWRDAGAAIEIEDIAGEGRPWVGLVERRGADLVLVAATGEVVRLTGPLARPRLAGPGYTIWALGPISDGAMRVRRLGVLRPPR